MNTELNWTYPGEYLKVHSAIWKTVANCGRTFINLEDHNVVMRMQNKCSNKTPCVFTVEHSSFGVSCSETSSNLDYSYTCVSKSLFLLHYFNKETVAIIGQTNKSGIYTSCQASTLYKYKYDHANQSKTSYKMLYTKLLRIQKLDYR